MAAAKEMRVGTVRDPDCLDGSKVEFPPNIYSMVATLTEDNTWKITIDTNTAAGDSTTATTTTVCALAAIAEDSHSLS